MDKKYFIKWLLVIALALPALPVRAMTTEVVAAEVDASTTAALLAKLESLLKTYEALVQQQVNLEKKTAPKNNTKNNVKNSNNKKNSSGSKSQKQNSQNSGSDDLLGKLFSQGGGSQGGTSGGGGCSGGACPSSGAASAAGSDVIPPVAETPKVVKKLPNDISGLTDKKDVASKETTSEKKEPSKRVLGTYQILAKIACSKIEDSESKTTEAKSGEVAGYVFKIQRTSSMSSAKSNPRWAVYQKDKAEPSESEEAAAAKPDPSVEKTAKEIDNLYKSKNDKVTSQSVSLTVSLICTPREGKDTDIAKKEAEDSSANKPGEGCKMEGSDVKCTGKQIKVILEKPVKPTTVADQAQPSVEPEPAAPVLKEPEKKVPPSIELPAINPTGDTVKVFNGNDGNTYKLHYMGMSSQPFSFCKNSEPCVTNLRQLPVDVRVKAGIL